MILPHYIIRGGPIFTNLENKKLQEFFEKKLNIFCKKKNY